MVGTLYGIFDFSTVIYQITMDPYESKALYALYRNFQSLLMHLQSDLPYFLTL